MYPWRRTDNTYKILVAEFMLRRTRAEQVAPVYEAFIDHFPSPESLAAAPPRDIRRILNPLGLKWRIENFVQLARVFRRRNLCVAAKQGTLKYLPGVGDYVAGAIACFGRAEPVALIDTNVVRVLSRYFGLRFRGESRRNKSFIRLAEKCIDVQYPREYNWALFDLGGLVCTPSGPKCSRCPLRRSCYYNSTRDRGTCEQ